MCSSSLTTSKNFCALMEKLKVKEIYQLTCWGNLFCHLIAFAMATLLRIRSIKFVIGPLGTFLLHLFPIGGKTNSIDVAIYNENVVSSSLVSHFKLQKIVGYLWSQKNEFNVARWYLTELWGSLTGLNEPLMGASLAWLHSRTQKTEQ